MLYLRPIRDLRREKNVRAPDLGKTISVNKNTIYSWEHGLNFPNNDKIGKLATDEGGNLKWEIMLKEILVI